jgi:hypothetical protein
VWPRLLGETKLEDAKSFFDVRLGSVPSIETWQQTDSPRRVNRIYLWHVTTATLGCARLRAKGPTPAIRVAKGCCDCSTAGNRFAQRSLSSRFLTFGVVTPYRAGACLNKPLSKQCEGRPASRVREIACKDLRHIISKTTEERMLRVQRGI